MTGLTRRQRDLLDFIGSYMATENVAPSYEEMKVGIGVASKSAIYRLVSALEERGFIERLPNRARTIEILETPRPILAAPKSRPFIAADGEAMLAELRARGWDLTVWGRAA